MADPPIARHPPAPAPGVYRATIVVPLLAQRDAWLRQCLLSALHQSVPTEVIVVTSPRTTASNSRVLADLERRYHNLRVLLEPPRSGFAGAINAGTRSASTGRVGLLLSDDWLDATAVEECLQLSTDIVSTGAKIYAADGITRLAELPMIMSQFEAQPTLEAKADYLRHFFLFVRARLVEVGGVDETIGLTGPDDYDLVWTLLEHGATASVTERPLYNYRDHLEGRLTLRARSEQVLDLGKILDKHGVHGEERTRVTERHSAWYGVPWHVASRRLQAGADERPRLDDSDVSARAVDLSVIICTWNNSRRLAVTLEAVSRCVIPVNVTWELVLVDNNCTDDTAQVVRAFAATLPLVVIHEPRQGLSRARNAGLKAAAGRLVVFTDDDVTPCPEWLETYWEAYRAKPSGYFFGGPIASQGEVETWNSAPFDVAAAPVTGIDWGPEPSILPEEQHFLGANWACPADALRASGGFDVRLGLDASLGRRRVGEEFDLMDRLRRRGVAGWYLPQAGVVHFVPREKSTLAYIAANSEAQGVFAVSAATPVRFLRHRPGLSSLCGRPGPVVAGVPLRICLGVIALACRWRLARIRGRPGYEEYLSLRFCIGVLRGYRERTRDRTDLLASLTPTDRGA
jgi:glycosyltransferase involved in cell wall biosynthesis